MSARCSSVAGNGNCVGIGGGSSHLGQSQLMSCTLLESTVFVDITFCVTNCREIVRNNAKGSACLSAQE